MVNASLETNSRFRLAADPPTDRALSQTKAYNAQVLRRPAIIEAWRPAMALSLRLLIFVTL
jgi:hypothetical protein